MDPASLYPQPQPPGGLMGGNPLQLFGAMNQINALRAFQARQAVGNALLGARNPDGSIDTSKFITGLPPEAAVAAPEAAGLAYDLRSKQIANDTAQFGLGVNYNAAAQGVLAGLGGKDAIADSDLWDASARLARMGMPAPLVNAWRQTMLGMNPDQRKQYATTLGITAAGPAAVTTRQNLVGPDGQPISVPTNVAARQGALPAGTPPGTEQSAALMQSDLARAGNFGQDIFPWQRSLDLLQKLGPGGTGPGTQGRQQIESFINALSPTIAQWLPGIDVSKIQNYDELNKYLTQATQARAASFGHQTDMELATAISGNPNVHINDLAATDVVKAAIALRRMEQAQTMESAKAGPVGYSGAKAAWPVNQDPRAYAIDMMSPEEISNLQKTLKGPERDKFNRSLQSAINANLITRPGQSNGQ